ncbi:MAG: thioredoxin domain-containing protein [Thermoplasmatota archaeon]
MRAPRIATDANLFALPSGLPRPTDDGAARHLVGALVPHVRLPSTTGGLVDVGEVARQLSVFFLYPATVAPGIPIPGEWSEVPGARGCTVQNLGFREAQPELVGEGCTIYGISGQGQVDPELGLREQKEAKTRLQLPFELLNDSAFRLASALKLPTFVAKLENPQVEFEGKTSTFPLQGRRLLKRLTFVADQGRIEKVFYPVFPPDLNAKEVLAYLRVRRGSVSG